MSRGDAPELDPEEHIEVGTVPGAMAQLTVALLERNGIGALALTEMPGGQLAERAAIRVRRRDADEARRLIDDEL